jgi:RNA polymerase sigma-70 factor, ECF subfamily
MQHGWRRFGIVTGDSVKPADKANAATSLTLLDKVRASDKAAWERLHQLYEPLVRHWCRQALLQEADTADVSQEVFFAVSNGIGEFHKVCATDTFRGWLRVITRRKICNRWRQLTPGALGIGGSNAQGHLLEVPGEDDGSSGDSADTETGLLWRRAVELIATDFNEQSWKAFWRVVIEGRSATDVAADLGMTANAVYLAKARILARLREEFGGLIEE